ncbi:MAG: DUF2971 domain-containing protein [Smithella sp.]|jgi:hypothetical protein
MWKKINREDVPEILYHYCSLGTFKAIIENKTIRLSNIFKMNDSSEVMHVLELLPGTVYENEQAHVNCSALPFKYKGKEGKELIDELVLDIKKDIEKVKYPSYIASFSKHQDDLGQWRGYADDGCGVAIGYDGKKLYDIVQDSSLHITITDVCYSLMEHKDYIKRAIVPLIFKALENAANNGNVKNGQCPYEKMVLIEIVHAVSACLLAAAQYKHKDYENEQEWRLCFDPLINQTWSKDCNNFSDDKKCGDLVLKKMSFTNKGGNIISSYFDLYLGCMFSDMIKEVILGPRSMNEDNIDMKMFLQINGINLAKCYIHKSEIPYIGLSK